MERKLNYASIYYSRMQFEFYFLGWTFPFMIRVLKEGDIVIMTGQHVGRVDTTTV